LSEILYVKSMSIVLEDPLIATLINALKSTDLHKPFLTQMIFFGSSSALELPRWEGVGGERSGRISGDCVLAPPLVVGVNMVDLHSSG
jgi:hypothetical protein